MQKVIGLAGHIDHGKTALVKALTGVDTDRLEEEKRRGVTIDIGIAFYNDEVTLIDVPGHEKFIKNMVTGVSTVDAALLVIAADDGVMPQTREHLDILQILGVKKLLVALNKIDLVDPEWVDMVTEDVREFLSDRGFGKTPIIAVSSVNDMGIDVLRTELDLLIQGMQPSDTQGIFRLPIDRVFSVKGFGTVVTGTVLSHELNKAQSVELFPQQLVYPVRGLQSHNSDVSKIKFGDRGAINLGGASVDELGRGAFLGSQGMFQTGDQWLVYLEVLPHWTRPVKEAERVHVHVGTGKREARIHLLEGNECRPGEGMWTQLFFDQSVAAGFREKVVIRFLSPEETLGGASMYWVVDRRLKKRDECLKLLEKLESADLPSVILSLLQFFQRPMTRKEIARHVSVAESKVHPIVQNDDHFIVHQERYLDAHTSDAMFAQIRENLEGYHQENPLGKGLPSQDLGGDQIEIRDFILAKALADGTVRNQGNLWQLSGHQSELDESDEKIREAVKTLLNDARYSSPPLSDLQSELGEK